MALGRIRMVPESFTVSPALFRSFEAAIVAIPLQVVHLHIQLATQPSVTDGHHVLTYWLGMGALPGGGT